MTLFLIRKSHQRSTTGLMGAVPLLRQMKKEMAVFMPLAIVTSGGDAWMSHRLSPTTRKMSFRKQASLAVTRLERWKVLKLVSLSCGNKQLQCVSGLRQHVYFPLPSEGCGTSDLQSSTTVFEFQTQAEQQPLFRPAVLLVQGSNLLRNWSQPTSLKCLHGCVMPAFSPPSGACDRTSPKSIR